MAQQNALKAKVALALCAAAAASIPALTPAGAAVLFMDDFNGLHTDSLNGTTPDVTQGSTAWVADDVYAADGSKGAGSPPPQSGWCAYLTLGNLINDNRGNADALYTLSATMNVDVAGDAIWEALGFWKATAPADNFYYDGPTGDKTGVAWTLRRGNGDLRVFRGTSTANGITENTASPNDVAGEVDLQIALDLTTWNGTSGFGTVTYLAKLSSAPTYTEIATGALDASNSSFGAVGVSGGAVDVQLNHFELVQVPEVSSSVSFILFALFSVAFRRYRSR